MSDTHIVARDQLRAFIERIERLEEEKKTIADDIKDVKAEAKGCGFDVGTINAIVKLRKVDANERAERDALLDTYMAALGMLPDNGAGHDAATGEILDVNPRLIKQIIDGMQTETGRKALIDAVDVMIEREEAEITLSDRPALSAASGGEPSVPSPDAGGAKMEDRSNDHPGRAGEEPVVHNTQSEQATNTEIATNEGGANPEEADTVADGSPNLEPTGPVVNGQPNSPETANETMGGTGDDCNFGNRGVWPPQGGASSSRALNDISAEQVVTAGETAPLAKPPTPLRPHCRNPGETCGGSGRTHCYECTKAMREREPTEELA